MTYMILRLQILFLFLNICQCAFSQVGSVRIQVYNGGRFDFIFNTISDYKAGIIYTNYTLIGIEAIDPPAGTDYLTWELRFEADDINLDGNFNGTNPANIIPLGAVEVQSSLAAGCISCNFFGSPWIALTGASQLLADGNLLGGADDIPPNLAITTDQINISYRCGFTTSLLGATADYYADDLFIDIIMSP